MTLGLGNYTPMTLGLGITTILLGLGLIGFLILRVRVQNSPSDIRVREGHVTFRVRVRADIGLNYNPKGCSERDPMSVEGQNVRDNGEKVIIMMFFLEKGLGRPACPPCRRRRRPAGCAVPRRACRPWLGQFCVLGHT